MERSEPTTGEIVRALRCVAEETECKDCRYKYPVGNVILCDHEQMNGNAADRLESQERDNSDLRETLKITCENWSASSNEKNERIAALTARAEQAERERDAAFAEFDVIAQDGLCEVCFFGDFSEVSKDTCMEDCCFQWRSKKRGLAQEGDGERCRVEF